MGWDSLSGLGLVWAVGRPEGGIYCVLWVCVWLVLVIGVFEIDVWMDVCMLLVYRVWIWFRRRCFLVL